jgi:Ca2+-binding EF-hand superfamily protein
MEHHMSHASVSACLFTIALFASLAHTRAQRPEPEKSSPPPDHCRGTVDPYNLGAERIRFFRAAGKDTELSAEEFKANRTAEEPFVRRYDTWAALRKFDRDGNGTIDWLEADTYRRDLRKRMLQRFDANHNGRLDGEERPKANAMLHAGRTPRGKRKRPAMGGLLGGAEPTDPDVELLQSYDADGDGTLSEAELKAAMADQKETWREEALLRYDTDGDGKLSDAERRAMYDERIEPWQRMRHRLQLKLFDEDGDGQLSEVEKQAEKAFGKEFQHIAEDLRQRMADIDGDGEITAEEREIARKEMMVFSLRMMVRMRNMVDSDSDGDVTAEESAAFRRKMAAGVTRWTEGFIDGYDLDRDGRFTQAERDELAKGLRAEMDRRVEPQDRNDDGRLDGVEMEQLIVTWGQDAEVFPATEPAEEP